MKCPKCQESELVMADRQGVEIDYCPRCRGVWLDRGELDKIMDRAAEFESNFRKHRDDDVDDDDDRHRFDRHRHQNPPAYGNHPHPSGYKKRKSFWSELFD